MKPIPFLLKCILSIFIYSFIFPMNMNHCYFITVPSLVRNLVKKLVCLKVFTKNANRS